LIRSIVHLTATVAARNNIPKSKAAKIVNTVFDEIQKTLKDGHSLKIYKFGTFEARTNRAGPRRNIRTGEVFQKKASARPHFRYSASVKKFINQK